MLKLPAFFFFYDAKNCNLNPKCVRCSDSHTYSNCPRKTKDNIEKPSLVICNCGEQHSASYKGRKNYSLKLQFRKFYAEIAKKSEKPKIDKHIKPLKKVAHQPPKMTSLAPEQLY